MSESLEARKAELFATITLRNATAREIRKLQAVNAPLSDLQPLYDRQDQLDADKERLTLEVYNEALYRNLGTVLTGVDALRGEVSAANGLFQASITTLGEHVHELTARFTEVEATVDRVVIEQARQAQMQAQDRAVIARLEHVVTSILTDIEALKAAERRSGEA